MISGLWKPIYVLSHLTCMGLLVLYQPGSGIESVRDRPTDFLCYLFGVVSISVVVTLNDAIHWWVVNDGDKRSAVDSFLWMKLAKALRVDDQKKRQPSTYLHEAMPGAAVTATEKSQASNYGSWYGLRRERTLSTLSEYVSTKRYRGMRLTVLSLLCLIGLIQSCWYWRVDKDLFVVPGNSYVTEGTDNVFYYVLWDITNAPDWMYFTVTFLFSLLCALNALELVFQQNTAREILRMSWVINELTMPVTLLVICLVMEHITAMSSLAPASSYANWQTFALPLRMLVLYNNSNEFLSGDTAVHLARGNDIKAVTIQAVTKFVTLFIAFVVLIFFCEYDPLFDWTVTSSLSGDPYSYPEEIAALKLYPHLGLLSNSYYTTITFSTVGYGDWSPITPLGRVIMLCFIAAVMATIPAILDKYSTAKANSNVIGELPWSWEFKRTVVVFGPLQALNAATFVSYVEGVNATARSKTRISNVVFVVPEHRMVEVEAAVKSVQCHLRVAFIVGDLGFGAPKYAQILERLRIKHWKDVRELIFYSDFVCEGDVIREARMTLSRIDRIFSSVPDKLRESTRVRDRRLGRTVLFNGQDSDVIQRHHSLNGHIVILSRAKAKLIRHSLMNVPGLPALMVNMFALALGTLLREESCLRLNGWKYQVRVRSLEILLPPGKLYLFDALAHSLWTFNAVILLGVLDKVTGTVRLNALGVGFNCDPSRHDLIVLCKRHDLLHKSHIKKIEETLLNGGCAVMMSKDHLKLPKKTANGSTYLDTPEIGNRRSSRRNSQEVMIQRLMEEKAGDVKGQYQIVRDCHQDYNEEALKDPKKNYVVIFGSTAGMMEILHELVSYRTHNILWVTCCDSPALRHDVVRTAQKYGNLAISAGPDVGREVILSAIHPKEGRATAILLLPDDLIDEEVENEQEPIFDTHVYVTRNVIRNIIKELQMDVKFLFNIEHIENLSFFDTAERSTEHRDPWRRIMDSECIYKGECYLNGMENIFGLVNDTIMPSNSPVAVMDQLLEPGVVGCESVESGCGSFGLLVESYLRRDLIAIGLKMANTKSIVCNPSQNYIVQDGDVIYFLRQSYNPQAHAFNKVYLDAGELGPQDGELAASNFSTVMTTSSSESSPSSE